MGWGRPAPLRCELNLLRRHHGAGWVNKEIRNARLLCIMRWSKESARLLQFSCSCDGGCGQNGSHFGARWRGARWQEGEGVSRGIQGRDFTPELQQPTLRGISPIPGDRQGPAMGRGNVTRRHQLEHRWQRRRRRGLSAEVVLQQM